MQVQLLPETYINTFIPCFFLIKKLWRANLNLLDKIESKQNYYNHSDIEKVYQDAVFQAFYDKIKQFQTIIDLYYIEIQFEVLKIMEKMSSPNQKILEEIKMKDITPSFEDLFKENLLTYYSYISEERDLYKNKENKKIFTMHMI